MPLSHHQAMQLAINSALTGIQCGAGGPFGAVIVRQEQVLAVAHNTVLADRDPTCHAEMNAIRLACQQLNHHDLTGCKIYTTAEPCPMCMAAIFWARLEQLYIGVDKAVAARFGFDDEKFYQQLQHPTLPSQRGILATECAQVFEHWQSLKGTLY
jgi:tRNA(Arg) A34 adenosine deaminase TadA